MANLVITAALVVAARGARTSDETAGATITAGQLVARDTTSRRMILADTDGVGFLHEAVGLALNSASDGQPLEVLLEGDVDLGPVLTGAGNVFVASATAGSIAPVADLAAGYFTTVLGVSKTATRLAFKPITAGVARP